jgi:hypothetical protein
MYLTQIFCAAARGGVQERERCSWPMGQEAPTEHKIHCPPDCRAPLVVLASPLRRLLSDSSDRASVRPFSQSDQGEPFTCVVQGEPLT